jgi:outer membrane protein assembly factor BamB
VRQVNSSNWAAAAASVAVLAAGIWLIAGWLRTGPGFRLGERVPEPDPGASISAEDLPKVDLQGVFAAFEGKPSASTASWPRFRGADFDNIAKDGPPLAATWPAGGPPVLWSIDLGEGHAGAAVRHGRVYVLDYDEQQHADSLRCFSFDDGREIWRRSYKIDIKRNHGISRTVPAVSEKHVLTVGPRCHALCVDAFTGDFKWGLDLAREYGTREPLWYTAQCPLLDGETAILAPGGRALIVAVDAASGRILWESPNPDGWQMSHASIVPMTFGGRRMYVYAALGGVAGIAADGPEAGRVLWKTSAWNNSVTAPSPVILPGGRIFLTAGYGSGSLLLQLKESDGALGAETVWKVDKSVFACEQQTPVFYRERLFTVMPNDAGEFKRQLAIMDPNVHNACAWTSGKTNRFGLGPFIIADGKILVLNDDGMLTLAEASTEQYRPLASAKVLDGRDAWGPMAVVDGRLLARDSRRMVCLDLRKR